MRANHSSDDLAVWTAPDSLATNLAELDDWLTYRYGVNLHEFLAGRRASEGRWGAPLPDSQSVLLRPGTVVQDAAPATPSEALPPRLRGQVDKPAPIPSDSLPSPAAAGSGDRRCSPGPSSPDHRQPKTTFPVSYLIRARQAAHIAAVGITSLALWRLISALLRRGN